MFAELQQHPDLFDPLRDGIIREVNAANANWPAHESTIDSSRLGKNVLENVGSWWHGEFPRRFREFPNGAARGITGMSLWNYLASPSQGWWSFTEVSDRHGYGENHMLYVRLRSGDPLIPMPTANPALVSAFRTHLLPEFGRHGACDPWWWPVGPGQSLADWGLRQGEERQLSSLRDHRDGTAYLRFLGSLGAKSGATWVISTRPSPLKSFPMALGPLHTCLWNADVIDEAHVTDLAKFRGEGPDSRKNEGMTPDMWELSIRCLHDEYAVAPPSRILITREARKWFRERNSLINAASSMRQEWRRNNERRYLDGFLTTLENHANSAEVCFWRAPGAPGEWLAALRTLK